jgi:hypothetical protein
VLIGLLVALLAVVLVVAAVLAGWLTRQNRLAVRRRVMVNLVDGKAVEGLLWARRGRVLVLKDATLHERGVDPTTVDGEVLVDRHRVDFVQAL